MPLPLSHLRVLDLSRVLAGPYCTMLLGDLGADVLKVERPEFGDDTRQWGPPFAAGESAYYLCCNRNKRSLTVNLKSEAGRDLVRQLADRSDVLVENFLPGTLDGWGLGYESLSKLNPRLVYCSISGFGQTGPWREEPGYDIMVQAMAGVMSITGEEAGLPMKVGVAIADITAGLFACNGIQAALLARERTGRGDRVDIALFDSTVAWLANVGSNYLVSGEVPHRLGTAHPNIVPYQAFLTADETIIIGVGNDSQFQRFCTLIQQPDLAVDERFQTNAARVQYREELIPQIARIIATRPAADWLADLKQSEIPAAPVNSIDRVFEHPQIEPRHMLLEVMHPRIGKLRLAGSPVKLDSLPEAREHRPPPLLGEHTEQVLQEVLGVDAAALQQLRASGVV